MKGPFERAFGDVQHDKITRTGLMIHYVIQKVDRGQPIITQEIDINAEEKLEDLQERLHSAEHNLIVKGTRIALEIR